MVEEVFFLSLYKLTAVVGLIKLYSVCLGGSENAAEVDGVLRAHDQIINSKILHSEPFYNKLKISCNAH